MSAEPSLFQKPTFHYTLKPYQSKAVGNAVRLLKEGKNPLIIMATGTGKTVVGSSIIKERISSGKKILWLAHREELIDQAKSQIDNICQISSGLERAEHRANLTENVIVGSVPTLRKSRLDSRFSDFRIDDIIIDECHHATADSYQTIIEFFQSRFGSNVVGLTATPDGAKGGGLKSIFSDIAYNYSLLEAIKDGNLCNLIGVKVDCDIDLSGIRTVAGDLDQGALDDVMSSKILNIAEGVLKETIGRRTIVFTVSVRMAVMLEAILKENGIKAKALSAESSVEERRYAISQFRRGEITHLLNCALFTEGFDCPEIEAVVIACPTKSRTKYSQMVGRGTRLSPGKSHCLLVEFGYQANQHQLVKPFDLFITEHYSPEVRKEAERLSSLKPNYYMLELLELAKENLRKSALDSVKIVQYGSTYYDPFALLELKGKAYDQELDLEYEGRRLSNAEGSITSKQKEILAKLKVINTEKMSVASASLVISIFANNGWSAEKVLRNSK
ncbi:DEAD/DEAH box helicase [Leptospira bouyouniensis]|uniref:DEAD/DEAH box helicase n=1 Tax=Leptospira bouyouniensis TaxID=2484911 RepID=A0A7I0HRG5_9LEPT|nr:DEAD/DEAH box helicase [Leptospira bouyouniensis]TGL04968.1 DEAD/DEAH box helicase [Leptospira bouyouniensis]